MSAMLHFYISGCDRITHFFIGHDVVSSAHVVCFCAMLVSPSDGSCCLLKVLAGLAFMFSSSILLQILACAIYSNWWPMLSALMYVVVPMPCLFFGGGSTHFLTSKDGGGWIDAAKFLTGASSVGSIAIPIVLRHANMIETGAMFIVLTSFFIFVCTVLCFHRASLDDDW
ncbi:hypothetical protein Ancab_031590 [Ancistrocladus abbreviatus]